MSVWQIHDHGEIRSKFSGKCLDAVQTMGNNAKHNVQVYACSGADNQKWGMDEKGQIKSDINDKCLTIDTSGSDEPEAGQNIVRFELHHIGCPHTRTRTHAHTHTRARARIHTHAHPLTPRALRALYSILCTIPSRDIEAVVPCIALGGSVRLTRHLHAPYPPLPPSPLPSIP